MLISYYKMQNIVFKFLKLIKNHECKLLQIIKIINNLYKIFKIF